MSDKTFYITTPIYYTNGIPHIGHAYSSLIADTLGRYQKISWKKVKFATWVDENSQKALQKAQELWKKPMEYLDEMAEKHKWVWDGLGIEYTDFIRTTEKRHHTLVRDVLQKCFDNWDIYKAEYEWMYCVWCEGFKKDDDLVYLNITTKETFPITPKVKPSENIIKVCPDHLTTPKIIKEKNWFFALSKYENFLKDFYKNTSDFVLPENRFNEVKAFVERGLEDFSISRETNTFGIKLPFDESQVTYVWFDALFNYVTVCSESDSGKDESEFWPANVHVVAKDIIRFHAIYWPAMLKSAGYDMPKHILTTGFYTVEWQKISKSLWNAIDPVEFIGKYNKELLVLYLLSAIYIWQDGNFSEKDAILQYNARLANNLGNLVNRVVVLSLKLSDEPGKLFWFPTKKGEHGIDFETFQKDIQKYFERFDLKQVLDESFKFLDTLNDFTTKKEPWQMIKDETKIEQTREVLYTIAEWLRQVGLILYPFFPEKMTEMFTKFGLSDYTTRLENGELDILIWETPNFMILQKWEPLFQRIDI